MTITGRYLRYDSDPMVEETMIHRTYTVIALLRGERFSGRKNYDIVSLTWQGLVGV